MNILFLYNEVIDPKKGGVERVTSFLGEYFKGQGCNVFYLSCNDTDSHSHEQQFVLPNSSSILLKSNVVFFRSMIIEKEIHIIINQAATNPKISKLAIHSLPEGVKLISVIHNSILSSINNFSAVNKVKFDKIGLNIFLKFSEYRIFKIILLGLYKLKYFRHYRLLCTKSDRVVILSEKYRTELDFITGTKSYNNIISINNPVPFFETPVCNKLKEVLYVGRVNFSQKRVDLLIHLWSLVHKKFPDWTFKIVGDGEDLIEAKLLASRLKINNIKFYGFSDPIAFYQTSSIFCMSSSFEGFPLTLIESMYCGSVPIVFNSFLSASEIIDDGYNGFLIPPFDLTEYSRVLSELMSNYYSLEHISLNAKLKVKNFNISVIGDQWFRLFKDLNCNS